ncbi:unnamed protein product [Darwinula stevensoni]|uniref:Uncharacterized protein n=1 Tax=Darwinula stevensoni TaxID=69355 RepID=A0A7R8XEX9_9CRUS|nr:unnamed protein product [Darwinula stevensoni]CAG0890020.1 unnamed protein product [Darwinula stevensoni]
MQAAAAVAPLAFGVCRLSMLALERGVTAAVLLPLAVESGPGPGPVNGEVSNDEEGSMNESDTGDLHDQDSLDSNDGNDAATPSGALNLVTGLSRSGPGPGTSGGIPQPPPPPPPPLTLPPIPTTTVPTSSSNSMPGSPGTPNGGGGSPASSSPPLTPTPTHTPTPTASVSAATVQAALAAIQAGQLSLNQVGSFRSLSTVAGVPCRTGKLLAVETDYSAMHT